MALRALQKVEIGTASPNLHTKPAFAWLALQVLVIDETYQRPIGPREEKTIQRIAAAFDWSKFGVVLVARLSNLQYAIIDGQCRATAALSLGLDKVPCLIIPLSHCQQAEVFAAVNNNVTTVSRVSLYHAQVAAREPSALHVQAVCAQTGVQVAPYYKSNKLLPAGTTTAVQALESVLTQRGEESTVRGLSAMVAATHGTTGCWTAAVVKAFVECAHNSPLREHPRFVAVFGGLDLATALAAAQRESARKRNPVHHVMFHQLIDFAQQRLAQAA